MSNAAFNFHETFAPQIIYLAKLLNLANEQFEGTKFEISNLTGIPTGEHSGKVVPHVRYLKYMDMIDFALQNGKYKLSLTELGKVVYNEDQYLMQDITKILLHYNLTNLKTGAPQWSYLFREFSYDYNVKVPFTVIEEKALNKFGKDLELGPVKTLYTSGDFASISPFELLDNKKSIKFKNSISIFEATNIYAYGLIKDWELILHEKNEITIDEMMLQLKWQKGFSFDYDTMLEVLDEFSMKGFIKLNKQLNPITLIKDIESTELVSMLYDNLI